MDEGTSPYSHRSNHSVDEIYQWSNTSFTDKFHLLLFSRKSADSKTHLSSSLRYLSRATLVLDYEYISNSYSIIQIRSNYAKLPQIKTRGRRDEKRPQNIPKIGSRLTTCGPLKIGWKRLSFRQIWSNYIRPFRYRKIQENPWFTRVFQPLKRDISPVVSACALQRWSASCVRHIPGSIWHCWNRG